MEESNIFYVLAGAGASIVAIIGFGVSLMTSKMKKVAKDAEDKVRIEVEFQKQADKDGLLESRLINIEKLLDKLVGYNNRTDELEKRMIVVEQGLSDLGKCVERRQGNERRGEVK